MNASGKSCRLVLLAALIAVLMCGIHCRAVAEAPVVSVVADSRLGPPAAHGLEKLLRALHDNGIACEQAASVDKAGGRFLVFAGLAAGDGPAARLLKSEKVPLPEGPEALVIRKTQWHGKPVWVIAGADDRGLMYAELDVADRIGWAEDRESPLSEVRDTVEKPDAPRAGTLHLHDEPRLLGKPLLRRGVLDALSRPAGPEPLQLAGRDLRLRERRLSRALLSLLLRRARSFPDVRMVGITPARASSETSRR